MSDWDVVSVKPARSTTDLIAENFPAEAVPTAVKIVKAESSGDPTAINKNKNGTQDSGLFQVNDVNIAALKKAGIIKSRDDLLKTEINAKAAAFLYNQSGFKPWKSSKDKWGKDTGNKDDGGWNVVNVRPIKQAAPVAKTETPAPQDFSSRVGEDLKKRAVSLGDYLTQFDTAGKTLMHLPEIAINTAGAVGGGVQDIVGQGIKSAVDTGVEAIPSNIQIGPLQLKKEKGANAEVLNTPLAKMGIAAIQKGGEYYALFKKSYPDVARIIESFGNIAALIPAAKGVEAAGETAIGAGKKIVGGVANIADKAAPKIYESALKGSTVLPFDKSKEITKTLLKYKIPVSGEGVGIDQLFSTIDKINQGSEGLLKAAVNQGKRAKTQPLINELENLKATYKNLPAPDTEAIAKIDARIDAIKKAQGDTMNIMQAQSMKKNIYKMERDSYAKGSNAMLTPQDPLTTAIRKAEATGLRKSIEETAPGIKSLNAEEGHLWDALPDINRASNRAGNYNMIPARSVIGGVLGGAAGGMAGGFVGAPVGAVLAYVADHPAFKSKLAIWLSKEGKMPYKQTMAEIEKSIKAGQATPAISGLLEHQKRLGMSDVSGQPSGVKPPLTPGAGLPPQPQLATKAIAHDPFASMGMSDVTKMTVMNNPKIMSELESIRRANIPQVEKERFMKEVLKRWGIPEPRADGGPVNPGNQYLVGERGPETMQTPQGSVPVGAGGPQVIQPNQPGVIIPNQQPVGLRPAVQHNGEIIPGEINDTHNLILKGKGLKESDGKRGFITPEGKFLDRKQAYEWVKKNQPEIAGKLPRKELFSEDYRDASGVQPKILSRDQAIEYLDKAKGDIDKARKLATKDGYRLNPTEEH